MVNNAKTIKQGKAAITGFKSAINYIRKDSPQNAEKVRTDILSKIDNLAQYPEKHPLDKYSITNDGTYRAFEHHHYRIAYRVLDLEVLIISFRHTSMEPLLY